MPTWGFRIRFICLWKDMPVNPGGEQLIIDRTWPAVSFQKIEGWPGHFTLCGSGFTAEVDATKCGERLKKALLIAGMRSRWPVDIGSDKATLRFSDAFRDAKYKASGIRILDDRHGLCVLNEESPVNFRSVTFFATVVPKNRKEFIDALVGAIEVTDHADDRLSAALALFNAARFGLSPRAKFLTLIMAVECLSNRSKRSDPEQALLRSFQHAIRQSHLSKSEKNALTTGLGVLKRESITSACCRLVEEKVGSAAAKKFRTCYDVRSRLNHGRDLREGDDFAQLTPALEEDVRQLFDALLRTP